jgi:hypothetical protein
MVAYERAVTTFTTSSESRSLVEALDDVFPNSEHDLLAESVFRKK